MLSQVLHTSVLAVCNPINSPMCTNLYAPPHVHTSVQPYVWSRVHASVQASVLHISVQPCVYPQIHISVQTYVSMQAHVSTSGPARIRVPARCVPAFACQPPSRYDGPAALRIFFRGSPTPILVRCLVCTD